MKQPCPKRGAARRYAEYSRKQREKAGAVAGGDIRQTQPWTAAPKPAGEATPDVKQLEPWTREEDRGLRERMQALARRGYKMGHAEDGIDTARAYKGKPGFNLEDKNLDLKAEADEAERRRAQDGNDGWAAPGGRGERPASEGAMAAQAEAMARHRAEMERPIRIRYEVDRDSGMIGSRGGVEARRQSEAAMKSERYNSFSDVGVA